MQIILKHRISKQMSKNESMMGQKLECNKFFVFQCKSSLFKLRSQPKTCRFSEGERLKITGNKLQTNFINHLWMLRQVKQNIGIKYYEIVHYKTDLVWTIKNNQIVLDEGDMKNEQLFEVIQKNGFVKIKDGQGNILQLDGILQLSDIHQKSDTCLFRFIRYDLFEPPFLKDTVFILSNQKDAKSLDLTNGGRKGQKDIMLFKSNNRINQRWKFVILQYLQDKMRYQVYIKSMMMEQLYLVYDNKQRRLVLAPYKQKWHILQTQVKEHINIVCAKENQFLYYDQQYNVKLNNTKQKWYVKNADNGLHMRIVQI